MHTPSVTLTEAPLDEADARAAVACDEAGAVVSFVGMTRDHHEGRPVEGLEYQAQETLARKELERLVEQARVRFDIAAATVRHRLGRVAIGEASVVIAVSAAHRGPAFDACRFLIDTLKQTTPIFKKEYFADGGEAVWVGPDGKPVTV